jgi:hypothetical protein
MNELEQSFWELVEAGEIELALSLDKGLVPDAQDVLLASLWCKNMQHFFMYKPSFAINTSVVYSALSIYIANNKIGDRTNIIFKNGRFVENLPF